jgi:hypothetical protein
LQASTVNRYQLAQRSGDEGPLPRREAAEVAENLMRKELTAKEREAHTAMYRLTAAVIDQMKRAAIKREARKRALSSETQLALF